MSLTSPPLLLLLLACTEVALAIVPAPSSSRVVAPLATCAGTRAVARQSECLLRLRGGDLDDDLDDEDDDVEEDAGADATLENPFLGSGGGGAGGLPMGAPGMQDLASTLKDPAALQDALKELQDPAVQQQVKAMLEDPSFQESMKQYMEQITKDPQFEALKKQTEEMMKDPDFVDQMTKTFSDMGAAMGAGAGATDGDEGDN